MDKLLAGEHPVLEALREQFRASQVSKRELTGCGFFTYFKVDPTISAAPTNLASIKLGDVDAKISGLEHGAGFVLFVTDGYLDNLEGYSYDELWPTTISDFMLTYMGGKRELAALKLDAPR